MIQIDTIVHEGEVEAFTPEEADRLRGIIAAIDEKSRLWCGREVSYLSPDGVKWEFILAIVHKTMINTAVKVTLWMGPSDGKPHIGHSPTGILEGIMDSSIFGNIYVQTSKSRIHLEFSDVVRALFPEE